MKNPEESENKGERRSGFETAPDERTYRYDILLIIGGIILLFVLIYTIREILNPFLILFATLLLLFPMRKYPIVKNLLVLACILFALWFFYAASGVLAPLIIAFILTYVFNPIVEHMEQRLHIQRWLAIIILLLATLGVFVLIGIFFVPIIAEQLGGLINSFPGILNDANALLKKKIVPFLSSLGVKKPEQTLFEQITQHIQVIIKNILDGLIGLVTGASAVVSQILNIVIVPFLCFYLLKDFDDIKQSILSLFPLRRHAVVTAYFQKIDTIFGQYVRGAILLAIINGILASILLWLVGVNYPLVLGILSGVLDLIPYFGLLIALVISVIVALFSSNPLFCIISVFIIMIGLRLLETTVLAPRIIGQQVGLHPVLMIVSLLIFGYFLGFIGLLIAVPTTAIILMLIREWIEWRDSPEHRVLEMQGET